MSSKKTVYLAGTMPHGNDKLKKYLEENEILERYFKKHGFGTLCPARGKDWSKTVLQLNKEIPSNLITYRDLNDIKRSDVVLARMYDGPSVGTSMEIFYAGHVLYKPTFVVTHSDEIREHPWIKSFSTAVFSDLKNCLEYIVREYKE